MNPLLRKLFPLKTRESIRRGLRVIYWPRDSLFCTLTGLKWHPSWTLHGLPIITQYGKHQIQIGENFIACSQARHNSIGVFQPVVIRAITPEARVRIGTNTGLSGVSISCRNSVSIGDNCLIGSGALITDNDAHPLKDRENPEAVVNSLPIVIEDDVFIGARSIILKGTHIGKGAVIGAGSVVTTNVRPGYVAAGNPCREIKKLL